LFQFYMVLREHFERALDSVHAPGAVSLSHLGSSVALDERIVLNERV
jgi:hypothetical protein